MRARPAVTGLIWCCAGLAACTASAPGGPVAAVTNQQALTDAVRRYKAAFAAELGRLPALLRTASAMPGLPHGPAHPGGPGHS